MSSTSAASYTRSRHLNWAGYALGFGLGGFFDGILLHQILQWHHLLSGLEQARHDLAFLILADGLFHLLMYIVTGWGLWLLWRARGYFSQRGADRRLLANALIGFGAWHVVDGVLSHWILGIHRIRMDVENPLFWDMAWLLVFGAVPLFVGWVVRGKKKAGDDKLRSAPLAIIVAVAVAGSLATVPPSPNEDFVVVMFRPGSTAVDALSAFKSIDARLVWNDAGETVWAVDVPEGADMNQLYGRGAMLISNSIVPLGCFDWLTL